MNSEEAKSSTTVYRAVRSSSATSAEPSGPQLPRVKRLASKRGKTRGASAPQPSGAYSLEERYWELLELMQPLFEFFSEVDDVFMEDDALSAEKRQMGMGRLYRSWKRARDVMDPYYHPEDDQRDTRRPVKALLLGGDRFLYPKIIRRR